MMLGLTPKTLFVLRQLLINCHTTSESALLLIGNLRPWDAEMLLRSVLEGTVRFVFLCNLDDIEREQRVQEFWEDLPESEQIRTSKRLQHILSQVDDPLADQWRPFRELLRTDAELATLEQKYSKSDRRRMEQQWSFGNLMGAIRLTEAPELDFRAMAFNYEVSSHLIHKDATALKIIRDRVFREEERQKAIEIAHCARMINDIFSLSALRAMFFYKVQKEVAQPLDNLLGIQRPFLEEIHQSIQAWHDIEYRER